VKRASCLILLAFLCACSKAPQAPGQFKVRFDTSKGPVVVEVHRDWAPNGVDRFYELVKSGYYDETRFFRVVPNFVVQWGINKDPKVSREWSHNVSLDATGFAPFGKVTEGMDIVQNLYSGYGQTPQQNLIQIQGNDYLQSQFPQLDYIKTARVEQ
jgi:peptidyl-prolyl cis-trans isomerase A (cyclophilin A)